MPPGAGFALIGITTETVRYATSHDCISPPLVGASQGLVAVSLA